MDFSKRRSKSLSVGFHPVRTRFHVCCVELVVNLLHFVADFQKQIDC